MATNTSVALERPRTSFFARPNVANPERAASIVVGGLLTYYGVRNRREPVGWVSSAVGGFLLERGLTGRCVAYRAMGIDTATPSPVEIHQAVQVMKPRSEVYSFWRDFANLAKFMKHVRSVEVHEGGRSHWVVQVTPGVVLEWDSVIVDDRPGERIAWRSVEEADIDNAGEVRFAELPGGRGTGLEFEIAYRPPAGPVGVAAAQLLKGITEQEIREDLRRFKNVIEAGEIPRTGGQPSGRGRSEDEPGGGWREEDER
jgi:uncharacterized membrane protein